MKNAFALLLMVLSLSSVDAQKLPNIQQGSLRAPVNIKIDGRANERDNAYCAFNKAAEVYYNIANNEHIFYVTIHAVKPRIIQKILEGGISLTFAKNKTTKNSNDVSILFPLLNLPTAWKILQSAGIEIAGYEKSPMPGKQSLLDSVLVSQKQNSLTDANTQLISNIKEIKFSGINEIKDTLSGIHPKSKYYMQLPLRLHDFKWITIYNEDDIKAMVQFDEKHELTYELSIPLKYVTANVVNDKLKYSVIIHGRGEDGRPGNTYLYDKDEMKDQDLQNPTDFSGEYTLAK